MSNQLQKVEGEKYLYFRPVIQNHKPAKMYYLRQRDGELDTERCLNTTQIKTARQLRDSWVHARTNQRLGITPPPTQKKRVKVTKVLDDYHGAKHPTIRRNIVCYPGEKHLRSETDAIPNLKTFFKNKFVDELNQKLLNKYHKWRCKQARKGSDGHRITDLELNTLSNALYWAVHNEVVEKNPIESRVHYYNPKKARKTKDVAPLSPGEFHGSAKIMFTDPRSESATWQWLWEGFSGMRTEESILLRFNPKIPGELGHVIGNTMCIRRADKNNVQAGLLHLHEGLQELRAAHAIWHEKRFPDSPWMFPGRLKNGTDTTGVDHIAETSLTSLLDRLFERGILERKYISHGGRAYYVLVRRSWGIQDTQIAFELHQIGGVKTLVESYGMAPPAWLEGKGPKYPWIPEEGPAWADLIAKLTNQGKPQGPAGNNGGPHSDGSACSGSDLQPQQPAKP